VSVDIFLVFFNIFFVSLHIFGAVSQHSLRVPAHFTGALQHSRGLLQLVLSFPSCSTH
jgi:hypothetical protein